MIRLHGHSELLDAYGEIFSETVEHLELNNIETNALTCLFVKESLTFSVLLPLHSHAPLHKLKKADFINMHQNFSLLLWGNGEPSLAELCCESGIQFPCWEVTFRGKRSYF